MPADHLSLTSRADPCSLDHPPRPSSPNAGLESAVAAVLAGTPIAQAATQAGIAQQRLIAATSVYQAAGRAALNSSLGVGVESVGAPWISIVVTFPDRGSAEHCATTILLPALSRAEAVGTLASWWFVRKSPEWRWRLRAHPDRHATLREDLTRMLDDLAAQHPGVAWGYRHYEPETLAFGGPEGMEVAHRYFHADSRAALEYLRPAGADAPVRLGPRETSLLVYTALLRAAGLDWHEQGDVWAHITELRPTADKNHPITTGAAGPIDKVRHLLQLDTRSLLSTGSEQAIGSWLTAATHAGTSLRDLADHGRLCRGIRAILAHHVVFSWNRLGLPMESQTVLAHAATTATLDPRPDLPARGGRR